MILKKEKLGEKDKSVLLALYCKLITREGTSLVSCGGWLCVERDLRAPNPAEEARRRISGKTVRRISRTQRQTEGRRGRDGG